MENQVNKERVALWADALLDPTLVQGRGRLASRGTEDEPWKQCCLDVACQVAIANGLQLEEATRAIHPGRVDRGYIEGWTNWTSLPASVMEWYGFDSDHVRITPRIEGGQVTAVNLNDDMKLTFPEISEAIRAAFLDGQG